MAKREPAGSRRRCRPDSVAFVLHEIRTRSVLVEFSIAYAKFLHETQVTHMTGQ